MFVDITTTTAIVINYGPARKGTTLSLFLLSPSSSLTASVPGGVYVVILSFEFPRRSFQLTLLTTHSLFIGPKSFIHAFTRRGFA